MLIRLQEGIELGGGGDAGVSSFKGRTGAVQPQAGDYTKAMVGLDKVDNKQMIIFYNLQEMKILKWILKENYQNQQIIFKEILLNLF